MNILGKGVDAIEVNTLNLDYEKERVNLMQCISIDQLSVGKYQPRKKNRVSIESIQDLAASIKEQGILQPIIVRYIGDNHYELIAGERRYLAAIEAGLKEIPCIIKKVNEKQAYAVALIENIQREQLSLLEESESILKLKDEFSLSVDEVSKLIGKPRTTVANLVRVASLLSPEGKVLLEHNTINFGHVRAVLGLDHELQNALLQYVADHNLSVRATEKIVQDGSYSRLKVKLKDKKSSVVLNEINKLNEIKEKVSIAFNRNIKIKSLQSGAIRVFIEFEDFNSIYDYLNKNFSEEVIINE